MNGKTAVVTGASGSIGKEIVKGLASQDFRVVLACRNLDKGLRTAQELKIHWPTAELWPMELNLASAHSIVRFVEKLKSDNLQPDLLVNNAGIMCKYHTLTEDHMETTLATNYLGPYLLTRLLLPMMSPRNRKIVNTVSCTYRIGKISRTFFDTAPERYGRFRAYSNSKLALLLFSQELLFRHAAQNVQVAAADPGVVNTPMISMQAWFDPLADLFFRPFIKTPEQGAQAILSALCSNSSNLFIYHSRNKEKIPDRLQNSPEQKWLWEATEQICNTWLGIRFSD